MVGTGWEVRAGGGAGEAHRGGRTGRTRRWPRIQKILGQERRPGCSHVTHRLGDIGG